MSSVSVRSNVDEVAKHLSVYGKRVIPTATMRALNRTAANVQTVARRNISKEMGLKQKDVKDSLKINKASKFDLAASVTGTGRHIRLIKFKGTRQLKAGVKSAAWGDPTLYPSTFIQTIPSTGGRNVFKRKTAARLPIKTVWGPSVPRTMASDEVWKAMEEAIRDRFPGNFRSAVEHLLLTM